MGARSSPPRPVVAIASNDCVYAESLVASLAEHGIQALRLNLRSTDFNTLGALPSIDVIVIETHELEPDRRDLMNQIRTRAPLIEVVGIASEPLVRASVRALRKGAFAILQYPVTGELLAQTIVAAVARKRRAQARLEELDRV